MQANAARDAGALELAYSHIAVWEFPCPTCGEVHERPELRWAFRTPAGWHVFEDAMYSMGAVTSERAVLSVSTQSGTEHQYFLKAALRFPIRESTDELTIETWVRVGESDFWEASEFLRKSDPRPHAPWPGQLMHHIPSYEQTTWCLDCSVLGDATSRTFSVVLDRDAHEIADDQRAGLTSHHAADVAIALKAKHGVEPLAE